MKKNVCILDYGSGNIGSLANMLSTLKVDYVISNASLDINNASHIILPGVGSFSSTVKKINNLIDLNCIKKNILDYKKPFLGICVGMQILATRGSEFVQSDGLDIIPGYVKKIDTKLILPHIGWNNIEFSSVNRLFKNIPNFTDFFFLNSYHFVPNDNTICIAKTNYEIDFCSAVNFKNIYGVQFHPEKSQIYGKILLKNFLDL
jgi:glutamine amidotransferase